MTTTSESAIASEAIAVTISDDEEPSPGNRHIKIAAASQATLLEVGPGRLGQNTAAKPLQQNLGRCVHAQFLPSNRAFAGEGVVRLESRRLSVREVVRNDVLPMHLGG